MTDYQVIWRGPVLKNNGLGIASREYALALDRQNVDIKVDAKYTKSAKMVQNTSPRLQDLIQKPYSPNKPKVLIHHKLPYSIDIDLEKKTCEYVILNTVWETSRIPQRWFPTINKFDAVFVPSLHNKIALINSGVNIPIYIAPHGVNTNLFSPDNKPYPLKNINGRFIFISIFGFQHRKNPEGLLKAYWEEFSAQDNVALVIKINGYGYQKKKGRIKQKIKWYKSFLGFKKNTAPIYLITDHLNLEQISGLYTLGKAFVLPTRGEGVCLPFLEALSSRVPVITTAWGGHMDFINEKNSFLIDYELCKPANSMKRAISQRFQHLFTEEGQLWAEPNIDSLKRQMRKAYENPNLCTIKGQNGRNDMLMHSWDRAGLIFKQSIESVIFNETN
ncbi:glycosyltransferase [Bacillus sp. Marseille-P3661]|uniref:glycosyltransferase n=1 Tax=Bacillus sp. Marseille-P3661 TaxID=1936234 RepID=UPI000C842958|nr:glycosyltransferase [Bacillus sp. Marseille-P3661]